MKPPRFWVLPKKPKKNPELWKMAGLILRMKKDDALREGYGPRKILGSKKTSYMGLDEDKIL